MDFKDAFTVTGSVKFTVSTTANNVTFNCPVKLTCNPGSSTKFTQKPELWTNTLAAAKSGNYYVITTAVCAIGSIGYATFDDAYAEGAGKTITLFNNCTYSGTSALNNVTVEGSYTLTVSSASITGGTYKCTVSTADRKISGGKFTQDLTTTRAKVAENKAPVKNGEYYEITAAKAKVGTTYYATFTEAYNAASSGTITLLDNQSYSGNLIKNVTISGSSCTLTIGSSITITNGTYDCKLAGYSANNISGGKFNKDLFTKASLDHDNGKYTATIKDGYYILDEATCKVGTEYFVTFDDAYKGNGETITLVAASTYSGSTALTNVTVNGDYTLTVSNANITGGTYNCSISITGKKISGGSFKSDVKSNVADEYCSVYKESTKMYDVKGAAVLMNGVYYYTFAEAYEISGNNNITLINSCSYDKNLTKDIVVSLKNNDSDFDKVTLTITSDTKVEKGTYYCKLINLNKSNISIGCKFNTKYSTSDLETTDHKIQNNTTNYEIIEKIKILAAGKAYSDLGEAIKAAGDGYVTIYVYIEYSKNIDGAKITAEEDGELKLTGIVKNSIFDCYVEATNVSYGCEFKNLDSEITLCKDEPAIRQDGEESIKTVKANYKIGDKYYLEISDSNITSGATITLYAKYTVNKEINFDVTFNVGEGFKYDDCLLTLNGKVSKGTFNCNVSASNNVTGGTFKDNEYNRTNVKQVQDYTKVTSKSNFEIKKICVATVYYYDTKALLKLAGKLTRRNNTVYSLESALSSYKYIYEISLICDCELNGNFDRDTTVKGNYTLTVNGTISSGTFSCSVILNKKPTGGSFTGSRKNNY